jgi:hypothetical protein
LSFGSAPEASVLQQIGWHRRGRRIRSGQRRLFLLQVLFEPRPERARPPRLLIDDVPALARIVLEVVQLRPGREDVIPRSEPERAQIAPSVVDQRHERLAEARLLVQRGAAYCGRERAA